MEDRQRPRAAGDEVLIPLDAEEALRALSEFRHSEERPEGAGCVAPVEPPRGR
jgi:hypothetical protein